MEHRCADGVPRVRVHAMCLPDSRVGMSSLKPQGGTGHVGQHDGHGRRLARALRDARRRRAVATGRLEPPVPSSSLTLKGTPMNIRTMADPDLMGDEIFQHQHGDWEQNYRDEVPRCTHPRWVDTSPSAT